MNPIPKPPYWKSRRYLYDYIIKHRSMAPRAKADPQGHVIPAHQYLDGGKMGGKPSDSRTIPLYQFEHLAEHRGDKDFWGNTNRARICFLLFINYLEDHYDEECDVWRSCLEFLETLAVENKWK